MSPTVNPPREILVPIFDVSVAEEDRAKTSRFIYLPESLDESYMGVKRVDVGHEVAHLIGLPAGSYQGVTVLWHLIHVTPAQLTRFQRLLYDAGYYVDPFGRPLEQVDVTRFDVQSFFALANAIDADIDGGSTIDDAAKARIESGAQSDPVPTKPLTGAVEVPARIVVPYTNLHPLTDHSLRLLAPNAERVNVSGDDLAYGRLLAELWKQGETFAIVEQDIEITPAALREAVECPCSWSTSPYVGDLTIRGDRELYSLVLGFARFRGELLRECPDAMEQANALETQMYPPGHWRVVNLRLLNVLSQDFRWVPTRSETVPPRRPKFYWPHTHSRVLHHHRYEYGCGCGAEHDDDVPPAPVRAVPSPFT